MIGCTVATIVVAKLEGEFDVVYAREILFAPEMPQHFDRDKKKRNAMPRHFDRDEKGNAMPL